MTDEDAYFQSLSREERIKQIQQVLEKLEREGRVKRTGEYRNGKPVYRITERRDGLLSRFLNERNSTPNTMPESRNSEMSVWWFGPRGHDWLDP